MKFQNAIGTATSVSTRAVGVSLSNHAIVKVVAVGGFCAIPDERTKSQLSAIVDVISGRVSELLPILDTGEVEIDDIVCRKYGCQPRGPAQLASHSGWADRSDTTS